MRIFILGFLACGLGLGHGCLQAAEPLPPKVDLALRQAAIPRDALSVVVMPVGASAAKAPRLLHHADVQRNPASLMKLVTTSAALDLLGPAYTWRTPLAVDGVVREGVLHGNVYIRGQGDPKIGVEHMADLAALARHGHSENSGRYRA